MFPGFKVVFRGFRGASAVFQGVSSRSNMLRMALGGFQGFLGLFMEFCVAFYGESRDFMAFQVITRPLSEFYGVSELF